KELNNKWYNYIKSLYNRHILCNYEKANLYYELSKNNKKIYYELGKLYLIEGNYEKAIYYYELSNDHEAKFLLSKIYQCLYDCESAIYNLVKCFNNRLNLIKELLNDKLKKYIFKSFFKLKNKY